MAVCILLVFGFFSSNECGFLHGVGNASGTAGEYAEVMNAALILLILPFAKVVNVAFCSLSALLHAQIMNLALCILVLLCKQMVNVGVYILLTLLCAQVVNVTLCFVGVTFYKSDECGSPNLVDFAFLPGSADCGSPYFVFCWHYFVHKW